MVQRFSVVSILLFAAACNGPLPFMSGGALTGDEVSAPSTWTLQEDFGVIQFETRPEDPYSVNIAYTQLDGRLYINAGDTETEWVKHMAVDPNVRMRLSGAVYPLRARRVTDPAEISAFGRAWISHGLFHRDPDELDEVWVYELTAR